MAREPMTTDELIAAAKEISGLVVLVALAAIAWIEAGMPAIHSMG